MTTPGTDRSVRRLRHSIRKRLYWALRMTGGIPGLTQEDQIQVLDKQIELITQALAKAKEAREIVASRDFDAYKTAKDAAAAAPAPEKVADSEEKSMTDLTFAELVAKLGGEDTPAEQPQQPQQQDEPPF